MKAYLDINVQLLSSIERPGCHGEPRKRAKSETVLKATSVFRVPFIFRTPMTVTGVVLILFRNVLSQKRELAGDILTVELLEEKGILTQEEYEKRIMEKVKIK